MKTLEETLINALAGLKQYPSNIEELAMQLHNITKACAEEADEYDLPYSKIDHRISEVV